MGSLAAIMAGNRALRRLGVGGTSVGPAGLRALLTAIKGHAGLRWLSLRHSHGFEEPSVVEALAGVLASNETRLAVLYLHGNRLGDDGARVLASALAVNHALTQIDLDGTGITASGVRALVAALSMNMHASLTNLNLNRNVIGDKGAAAIAEWLTCTDGSRAIPRSLQLSLVKTGMRTNGALALASALRYNPHVHTLTLEGHTVGEAGEANDIDSRVLDLVHRLLNTGDMAERSAEWTRFHNETEHTFQSQPFDQDRSRCRKMGSVRDEPLHARLWRKWSSQLRRGAVPLPGG